MEYDIVFAATSEDLVNEVNRRIVDYWQPLGGVAATVTRSDSGEHRVALYQAMTRPLSGFIAIRRDVGNSVR